MDILCYKDSYLKQCKSKVNEVNDYGVILDQTVFYPGGGGQPSDKGILKIDKNEFVVKNLKKIDGQIIHVIEGIKPNAGLEVDAIIDWDYRYKLMRTHTALHILCGVIWRDYSASVTGGDMKPLSGRMDSPVSRAESIRFNL